ncbi:hypothetical protein GALMADRAFT_1273851 [Galerina marginata CBS 339.88]|uniref:Uncharacterized protein n=1 Tax=Galerina marginata (strain CBS 339.88) TaxID=685588 RepID=A0A067T6V3_GALM3|nr:hypothetical protein GALMADRAFT_1273851 [Galerina marginata CBS 339.88]
MCARCLLRDCRVHLNAIWFDLNAHTVGRECCRNLAAIGLIFVLWTCISSEFSLAFERTGISPAF